MVTLVHSTVVYCTYPSEPFTQAKYQGRLAVGERMSSGSASTGQRRGNRAKAVLPVRVKGKDSAGKSFDELVHTLDVNSGGVRLGSVRRELTVGSEVTIFYRQRKIQFHVVWTKKMQGTSEFQVGLQALMQDREAWGMAVPDTAPQTAHRPVAVGV
jgi:hypothetical protein